MAGLAWGALAHAQSETPTDLAIKQMVSELAAHHQAHRLDEAEEVAREIIRLQESVHGLDDERVAGALRNLSTVLDSMGRFAESEAALERALGILETKRGPDDPKLVPILQKLGATMSATNRNEEARRTLNRALQIVLRTEGPEHQTAGTINGLIAAAMLAQRDFDGIDALFEEALRILEATIGPQDPRYAHTLMNHGLAHHARGDFPAARTLYERALQINESAMGRQSLQVTQVLNSLAGLLHQQGDKKGAAAYYEEAIDTASALLGPEHIQVAQFMNNYGLLLSELNEFDRALALLEGARDIWRRTYGADDAFRVVATRINIGRLKVLQGDYDSALPIFESVLTDQERTLGKDHSHLASTLNNLGMIHKHQQDFPTAQAYFERSIHVREQALGRSHPEVVTSMTTLAEMLVTAGQADEGRRVIADAFDRNLDFMTHLLPALSEREALSFTVGGRYTLWAYVDIFNGEQDAKATWEASLRWKGAVARTLAKRRYLLEGDSELAAKLADIRGQLARLAMSGGSPDEQARLRDQHEALERSLAEDNPKLRDDLARRNTGAAEVCASIPKDAVLVDFLQYGKEKNRQYLAFVVGEDCSVRRIELGPDEEIDVLVTSFREALSAPGMTDDRIDGRGARVYERVWAPIAQVLPAIQRAIVVPDAALNGLSFGTLPKEGRYLIEDLSITYLESATDLVRWQDGPIPTGGALFVGGIDYGQGSGPTCLGEPFGALPGTRAEVDLIERTWNRRLPNATVLTGAAASEGDVAANMKSQRLVHLASHGFFATDECRSQLSGGKYDPMALSGIALAYANAGGGGPHDGILTAGEVSGLDLRDTQLVVLSACETGLGQIQAGEGVLGLRRAFAASGARTLIMSLWTVPDDETVSLMADLYGAILRRRRPSGPAEALRSAQLAALARNRRTLGQGRPAEWGAFVSAGDWR